MIVNAIKETMIFIKKEISEELERQGHKHTGKLISSIEDKISYISDSIIAQIYMNDYWIHVNEGVSANRIPYKRGSGAKTSKYIQALIEYFSHKGLTLEKAKGAAFATANKHKKEGMPTKSSRRFSQNGKRTGFLTDVIDRELKDIISYLELNTENDVDNALMNILNKVIQKAA